MDKVDAIKDAPTEAEMEDLNAQVDAALDEQAKQARIETLEQARKDSEEKKPPTTISFKVDDPLIVAYIKEMQELMAIGSQREMTLFLIRLGSAALKTASATSLSPQEFARALHMVGRFGLHTGSEILASEETPAVLEILEGYERWRVEQAQRGRKPLQVVKSHTRPARVPQS